MVSDNQEAQRTAFTVTVDLAQGVTTGISASDRARTLRALADPHAVARDFVRPGHILPLRSRPGGVLERPGTRRRRSIWPGSPAPARRGALRGRHAGQARHGAASGARGARPRAWAADGHHRRARRHRLRTERHIRQVAEAPLPTRHGTFTCQAWRSEIDGVDHLALVMGDPPAATRCSSAFTASA